MKSGIKKIAHEKWNYEDCTWEKREKTNNNSPWGHWTHATNKKKKKIHAFDFSFTNCLNSFMSAMQYIPLSHEPLEPGSSNK